MPELPEVETVRLGLNAATAGHCITRVEVLLSRTIAAPTPAQFQQGVQGTYLCTWLRRGKYLLAVLGHSAEASTPTAGWLGVHLRMTGQLLWLEQPEPLTSHTRLRFWFAGGQELRFNDQRTFGRLWWISPSTDPAIVMGGLGHLGVEPLSTEFSPAYLEKILANRDRPLKTALLDQTLIAGLGNIYADEALFLSKLHPCRPCRSLTVADLTALHAAIQTILQKALAEGGTTFSDFRQVTGINGNYGRVAWVYRRTGQPCRRCQHPIAKLKMAGRSCHFCPHCQPLGSVHSMQFVPKVR